jgi:hypothetical protein
VSTTRSPVAAVISRLIPGIRFPWLFAILAGLLAIDLVVPDPIPFIDEAILTLLTVLAASWRSGRDEPVPPPRDVTPADASAGALQEGDAEPSGVEDRD